MAIIRYKKILRYLSSETNVTGEHGDIVRSLLLAAHLNLSLCHLRLHEDVQARDSCDAALELDNSNVKALYRRGLVSFIIPSLLTALHLYHLNDRQFTVITVAYSRRLKPMDNHHRRDVCQRTLTTTLGRQCILVSYEGRSVRLYEFQIFI